MKLFGGNDVDKLNNMVFEKRNKDYGAYALRSEYNQTQLKSTLLVTIGFFLSVFGLWYFSGGNKIVEEKLKDFEFTSIVDYNLEPKQEPKEPQQKLNAAAAPAGDQIGKPSNDAADTNTKPNDLQNSAVSGLGDPNATGTSATDTSNKVSVFHIAAVKPAALEPEKTHIWVEKMPVYNGNMMAFLQREIEYPEAAISEQVQGLVYVQFVINESGNITEAKIAKGIGYGCDEEALRVVKSMPAWKPGEMNGKPVRVMMNLPIRFQLRS